MRTIQILILGTFITLFAGCAKVTPIELTNARSAYIHASENPAVQHVPAELHKAHEALDLAEKSFLEEQSFLSISISYKTKDLAYVAQRKAELAETLAVMAADKKKAGAEFQSKQAEIVEKGKNNLSNSEKQTADALGNLPISQLSGESKAD